MDFLDSIKAYIEQNISIYNKPIQVGQLKDGNSIAIRPIPNTPPERYLEGSKNSFFGFQILTKHNNNRISYKTLQGIVDGIDGLTNSDVVSSDGSFDLNIIEVYVEPNWVETTPKNEYIYSAMFRADLHIKKGVE